MNDLTGDLIPDDQFVEEITRRLSAIPGPVDWRRLSAAAASAEWAALDEWIRWLVVRYDIDGREIPPCWHQHSALVEELSAVRGAHLVAFDPTQPASAAVDWHRILFDTRLRLKEEVSRSGCTGRTHHLSAPVAWVRSADYREQFERTICADMVGRP